VFLVSLVLTGPSLQALEYEPVRGAFSDRCILHVNGLSYHFGGSSNELNEKNWGLGFGYEIGRLGSESKIFNRAIVSINTDFYRDSFAGFGYAFGVALQNRLIGPIDLGLQVGLVHEDNIVDKGGLYLFPFLVPFLETKFDFPVNYRITLVPPLNGFSKGLLTFQALVRF